MTKLSDMTPRQVTSYFLRGVADLDLTTCSAAQRYRAAAVHAVEHGDLDAAAVFAQLAISSALENGAPAVATDTK